MNISSLQFEKVGEISSASFNSINGKTDSNEKSIQVFLNQEILSSSIDGTLDKFTVSVNGQDKEISSITLIGCGTAYHSCLILSFSLTRFT